MLFCSSFHKKKSLRNIKQQWMLLNIRSSQLHRSKTVQLLCRVWCWKFPQTRAEIQHQSGRLVGAESCVWFNSTPAPTLQPFLYMKTQLKGRQKWSSNKPTRLELLSVLNEVKLPYQTLELVESVFKGQQAQTTERYYLVSWRLCNG